MQLAQGSTSASKDLARQVLGEVGDMRLTIMAAVMVADELFEATGKIRRLEHDVTSGEEARLVATERAQVTEEQLRLPSLRRQSASKPLPSTLRTTPRPPATAPRRRARIAGGQRPLLIQSSHQNMPQRACDFGSPTLDWPGGAARCVRSHIPGALSILKGAALTRARGLGHMAPTISGGEPGSPLRRPSRPALPFERQRARPSAGAFHEANSPCMQCPDPILSSNAKPSCASKAARAAKRCR